MTDPHVPRKWSRLDEGIKVRCLRGDDVVVIATPPGRDRWKNLDYSLPWDAWELMNASGEVLDRWTPPYRGAPEREPTASGVRSDEVVLPDHVAAAIVALREAQNDVLDRFAKLIDPLISGYSALARIASRIPQQESQAPATQADAVDELEDALLDKALDKVGPALMEWLLTRKGKPGAAATAAGGNGTATPKDGTA